MAQARVYSIAIFLDSCCTRPFEVIFDPLSRRLELELARCLQDKMWVVLCHSVMTGKLPVYVGVGGTRTCVLDAALTHWPLSVRCRANVEETRTGMTPAAADIMSREGHRHGPCMMQQQEEQYLAECDDHPRRVFFFFRLC